MNQRIIRKPELFARVGLSDATIWRMEKAGKFPQRVRLGGNSVGWIDDEIEGWFADRLYNRVQLAGAVR
jgi:prophage regulatory protein